MDSSSSSSICVYLSFSEQDVRETVLSNILKLFTREGIDVFIANNIQRGTSLYPNLIEGIRGSETALVTNAPGELSANWTNEAATDVSNVLKRYTPSIDSDGVVGMRPHMEMMQKLLRLGLNEVRMIGIWGSSGGIGKRTIARVLYYQISPTFKVATLMVDIKRSYPIPCLDDYDAQPQPPLQKPMIVDANLLQLNAFPKEIQGFGYGSRIKVKPPQYKVFINYRGALRNNFVGHLVAALQRSEINVFADYQDRRGEKLNIFFKRIEHSRIAIVVFSRTYTKSEWCLNELAMIKEREQKGLLKVLPIFFKVPPSDVEILNGKFGDYFRKIKRMYKYDKPLIKLWKEAISYVSNILGREFYEESNVREIDFIEIIVNDVLEMLKAISQEERGQSSQGVDC